MREDEENCKSAFDEFLRIHYQDNDIAWQGGNEPPDYYLTLCGTIYAVEVTSLFEDIKLGEKTSSHLGFRKAVLKFLRQIEQEARQKGILNGAYIVGYKPLSDFGKQKKSISKSIIAYLQATQSVSSAPAEKIMGSGRLTWDIEKCHSEKQYLTGTTSDAKWEHQAVDELSILLNKVLDDKVHKLATISYPKILLIAGRYPWVERGVWNNCLPNLNQLGKFHTIFLVSHDRGNSVLHSIESTWLNQP
jgi:hypothetical protein